VLLALYKVYRDVGNNEANIAKTGYVVHIFHKVKVKVKVRFIACFH
jgi:hypothetical protein